MRSLFDTCTIKWKLENPDKVLSEVKRCAEIGEEFTISDEILKELRPPLGDVLDPADYKKADEIYKYVALYIKAKYIKQIPTTPDTLEGKYLKKIRKQYYGWMSDPQYCKMRISKGLLNEKVFKSPGFKFKDMGECSLIAVALTEPEAHTIISEDKGRVCAHPDINIFDIFREKNIKILNYNEWVTE